MDSVKLQNTKINIQKSAAFLYTSDKVKEIKETISFKMVPKKSKIPRN